MGELIDDLLVLHRVARAELQREPVHLSAIAHEIAANLRREQPEREVSFRIADDLMASGDVTLLRAALTNLIGNAWKFTAKKDGACIEFDRLSGANGDPFFVRDDGVGFDMTQAHRLFMPFQRLHERSEFDGTGIGLATVRRIVTKHGGRIWAEAAPGKGACFYFTLGPART
jgi:signal transduction histidine kinase